jgi:hypothetical protein
LELGASLEWERAWSLERLEPDPCKTQVSIFFLCLFCLFVCGAALHKIRNVAAQLHKQHLLLLFCAMQEVAKKKATTTMLSSPSSSCYGAAATLFWSYNSVAPHSEAVATL